MRLGLLVSCLLSAGAFAQYQGATKPLQEWKTGFDSITIEKSKDILGHLAGPSFRGRNPMNGDFNLAAGWLAGKLEKIGVQPAGDDGTYFHRFTYWETTPIPAECALRSADGGFRIPFGPEFSFMTMIEDSRQTPGFAFVSGSLTGDISETNAKKLSGRWVFLPQGIASVASLRKALVSIRPPVKGIFAANGRASTDVVNPRKTSSIKGFPDPRSEPIFALSFGATTIYQLASRARAAKFLDASTSQFTVETSDEAYYVDAKVSTVEHPLVNVVGKVVGSDPAFRDEAIVIGSHLDHLGVVGSRTYFGADDNASGCTANYLIAEGITQNPTKPKRSVFFCFWSSEELGLLGSYAFVQRPTLPLEKIAAYINMDMVGRNENDPRFGETSDKNTKSVYPSGVAFNSPEFLKVLFDQNRYVGLALKPDVEDRIMRSDSGSFAWKQIPTVKVFTGDHEDYHKPTDTPEKVNYEKMANIAKWLYLTVEDLASRKARPKWEPSPFKPKPWG